MVQCIEDKLQSPVRTRSDKYRTKERMYGQLPHENTSGTIGTGSQRLNIRYHSGRFPVDLKKVHNVVVGRGNESQTQKQLDYRKVLEAS